MESHGLPSDRELAGSSKIPVAGKIEPRRLMWAVAEVSWADHEGKPIRSRATIVDISTSGACIRLRDHIGIGERLTIKWHREQFSAISRNCRSDGADYLLGVRRDNNTPVSEPIPAKTEAAEVHATSSPSASPSVPVREGASVSKTAAVRDSGASSKTARTHIPEKRTRDILRKSPPPADSEARGAPVRRDAARQERKVMQSKRLFPSFWRRQPGTDAPTQAALKEDSVNKPTLRAAEHVSDPPERLLSYEDIYHAAGILSPALGIRYSQSCRDAQQRTHP